MDKVRTRCLAACVPLRSFLASTSQRPHFDSEVYSPICDLASCSAPADWRERYAPGRVWIVVLAGLCHQIVAAVLCRWTGLGPLVGSGTRTVFVPCRSVIRAATRTELYERCHCSWVEVQALKAGQQALGLPDAHRCWRGGEGMYRAFFAPPQYYRNVRHGRTHDDGLLLIIHA